MTEAQRQEMEKNKRRCIRIKDRILLNYQRIPEEECKNRVDQFISGQQVPWDQETVPHFKKIDGFLKKIRGDNEALAQVLGVLDEKLSFLIGRLVEMSGEEGDEMGKPVAVDISAACMGFVSGECLSPGETLEMTIGLLPEHYFFKAFGRVIRSEKRNNQWFSAVEFLWMNEEAKEKLVEHIFARQLQQLRMRRLQKEMEEEN